MKIFFSFACSEIRGVLNNRKIHLIQPHEDNTPLTTKITPLPLDPPTLLSGNEVVPRIQTGAAGQAWFSLDKSCALHYHLIISGMDRGRKNTRTAELLGFADYGEVPQSYDEHVHFLRSFEGETVGVYISCH